MKKDNPQPIQKNLQLVSISHAADRLDVGTRTVRRYIKNGLLEAVVMGGRMYRIRESSLQEFIAGLEAGRPQAAVSSVKQLDLGISHPAGEQDDD